MLWSRAARCTSRGRCHPQAPQDDASCRGSDHLTRARRAGAEGHDAAEHSVCSNNLGDLVLAQAVLQNHDRTVRRETRMQRFHSLLDSRGLGGEQHEVDRVFRNLRSHVELDNARGLGTAHLQAGHSHGLGDL